MGKQDSKSQSNDRSVPSGFADDPAPVTDTDPTPASPPVQPLQNAWNPTPSSVSSRLATMLLEAAVRFVDLPSAEFDAVITQTLDQLADHLQMEHVGLSIIQQSQSQQGELQLAVTHRYVAGATNLPSASELVAPYPWYAAQLRGGNAIILPNGPDDLPPEAMAERAYFIAQGVRCSLVIPLRIGEQLIGSLYFNSTTHAYTWPAPDLHALTLFARVLAGALQRKQAAEVLRRNEEQLALAIDVAKVGIWVWDLEHPERSYGSDNLAKIHGVSPCPKEQALQIYMASLHPDDRAEMEQLLAQCIQGEIRNFTAENRLFWPDGSLHWVEARGYVLQDASGRPQRITGILLEITGRKQVEAQIEQQRHELLRQARMMEQTERLGEIGGWEWDIANDAYYWTPETYRIFGLSPVNYTPEIATVMNFLTQSSQAILRRATARAVEFGENFDLKLQMHTAQDKAIWVRVAGQPEMVDGKALRLYGSIQDITLRSQIEEQLREAQKLEAIGQLAGGVAHDFNNLLTTINGMSELALLYLDKVAATTAIDRVRNYISEIHRAGERAAELTRQLLAFSRKQVLHPKVLDLRADVMKAQELLQQILGENIELVLVMPSHLGLVMADPSQIEQVIVNLVINAREAMLNGGTLTIRLLNVTIDEAAARQQMRLHPGSYVVLEVQDSGPGMTPEVQARLFDPFFTTKTIGAGTGLGLATVYGIVKQSGGLIEVESQLTKGTTFRIFLPQSTPTPQDAKNATVYVRGGTETILLVGDDAWARQGYRVALEAKGYHLLDAASGAEAITICQSYVSPIHLLIVSVLHDMTALALANQALLSRPQLRVLLLESGRSKVPPNNPAPPEYFVLNKPVAPEALSAKVRSVLDAPASMPLL